MIWVICNTVRIVPLLLHLQYSHSSSSAALSTRARSGNIQPCNPAMRIRVSIDPAVVLHICLASGGTTTEGRISCRHSIQHYCLECSLSGSKDQGIINNPCKFKSTILK